MSEELGSINKPEAGDIMQNKKVYIVTLVQAQPGAPEGFEEKYNKYWEAIENHLSQIETKAGVVNKIFCEGIVGKGDDAKLMLEQSNPGAYNIVRRRLNTMRRMGRMMYAVTTFSEVANDWIRSPVFTPNTARCCWLLSGASRCSSLLNICCAFGRYKTHGSTREVSTV